MIVTVLEDEPVGGDRRLGIPKDMTELDSASIVKRLMRVICWRMAETFAIVNDAGNEVPAILR